MSIVEASDFDIRYTNLKDTNFLHGWLSGSEMMHWFPPSDEQELENFIRVWMSFARYSSSITAIYKGTPIGMATLFLTPFRKVSHHCMTLIIVDPKYQRQGVGKALLKNLKHLAKNYFHLELIHMEVFENNPALPLLEEMGFKQIAFHEAYVKEGDRYYARLVMECEL